MILSHYAEDNTMVGPSMPSSQGPTKNITYLCNLPVKQTNFIARDIINVKCTEHCLNMGLLILYILSLWDADPILCATTDLGHLWDAKWFLKFQLLWNVLSNEYEIFNGNQPMSAVSLSLCESVTASTMVYSYPRMRAVGIKQCYSALTFCLVRLL